MKSYINVLRNYLNFNGRTCRKEFWTFVFINAIITFGLNFICAFLNIPLLSFLYALGTCLPSLAAYIRRMHDIGKSGGWLLVPIANLIFLLQRGDHGINKYGEDPLNPEPVFDFEQKEELQDA